MAGELVGRQRTKHTRSRLGCGVCRIRRIRCDQTKPICTRCTSTGRRCDGYPQMTMPSSSPDNGTATPNFWSPSGGLAPLRSPPNASRFTQAGGMVFDFYRINTSVELAGPLQDDLWTQLVLQVSHREDCVRQIVFALSSLHQSMISPGVPKFADDAAGYYALGLRSLNHHIISNEGAALDVTLLCSMLCITFEWLRGNHRGAEIHLKAGMKLLEQWYETPRSSNLLPRTSFSSPSGHLIRTTLSPAYTRLYLQAQSLLHDHGLPLPLESSMHDNDTPFSNFNEARDNLYGVLCDTYSFKRLLDEEKPKKRRGATQARKRRGATQARKRQMHPSQAIAQWSHRLDDLYERKPHLMNELGALVLQIWLITITIMIGTKESKDETDFDRFTPAFADVVDLIDRLYQQRVSFFCADISLIAILYLVGLKCRHPSIRRRAISLLSTTHRREGIWDSASAAKILTEILHIEEGQASQQILNETDLKSDERLRGFTISLDDDSHTWTLHPRELQPHWGVVDQQSQ